MKKLYNRKQKMMLAKNKKERILNPMDINSKWYTKSSINSTATFLATFSTHLYYDKLVAYGNVYPSFYWWDSYSPCFCPIFFIYKKINGVQQMVATF